MIPVPANGRACAYASDTQARPRRITPRECEEHGLSDMPTLGELIAATAFARRRGDERRAELYMQTAVRRLLRKQREARRTG